MPTEDPVPDIASPCVRCCCLDADDVCMGCGRHVNDIVAWSNASQEQKRAILQRAANRLSRDVSNLTGRTSLT